MYAFAIGLINALIRGVGKILSILLFLLPDSPFTNFLKTSPIVKYLGYINYFIPIADMIGILSLWTIAIGLVYIVQIALRWAKAME